MGLRVKEEGGSEGRPVAGRTGVEPPGDITPPETRGRGQPTGFGQQGRDVGRAVMALAGAAATTEALRELALSAYRAGGLQAKEVHRVLGGALFHA